MIIWAAVRGPLSALHCPHNQSVYNRFLGITNYTFEDGGCLLVNLKGPWNIQPVTYGLVRKLPAMLGQFMYLYFMFKFCVRFTFSYMYHNLRNDKSCVYYYYNYIFPKKISSFFRFKRERERMP